METNMIGFLIRMLEFFGVVFLRFRPVPRLWCVWLVGVNVACLYVHHAYRGAGRSGSDRDCGRRLRR